ncbi:hypothetical protein NGM37_51685, partial [Streptomyces sp. TRM76130]|nr:hypothetical protein [Streptomyces sp. TRM76130]
QRVEQFDDVQVPRNTHLSGMANRMCRTLAAAVSTPELEQIKDVWNMGAFGLGQWRKMDFTPLHQAWMRRACKTWVLDEIPRRYGKNIPNGISDMILCLRYLLQSWSAPVRTAEQTWPRSAEATSRCSRSTWPTWHTPARSAPSAARRSAASPAGSCAKSATWA